MGSYRCGNNLFSASLFCIPIISAYCQVTAITIVIENVFLESFAGQKAQMSPSNRLCMWESPYLSALSSNSQAYQRRCWSSSMDPLSVSSLCILYRLVFTLSVCTWLKTMRGIINGKMSRKSRNLKWKSMIIKEINKPNRKPKIYRMNKTCNKSTQKHLNTGKLKTKYQSHLKTTKAEKEAKAIPIKDKMSKFAVISNFNQNSTKHVKWLSWFWCWLWGLEQWCWPFSMWRRRRVEVRQYRKIYCFEKLFIHHVLLLMEIISEYIR